MASRGVVVSGRRTAIRATRRFAGGFAAVALALLALAVPGESAAQVAACNLVSVGATDQSGPGGSTLLFGFQLQGGCANPTQVEAVINLPDATGVSVVVPAGPFDATPATPTDIALTMGTNPGEVGSVTLSCPGGGCLGSVTYTYRTDFDFDYTAQPTANVVTNQIRSFDLATRLLVNGAPDATPSDFNNLTDGTPYGLVTPDAAGVASVTTAITAAGTYQVRAALACGRIPLPGCTATPPVDFTVLVEPVLLAYDSPATVTMTAGAGETLSVSYGSASFPGPDGTNISWSVTTQPAGGDGTVAGTALAGGTSDATFNATVPGTYTVQADASCAVCAVTTLSFTVDVVAAPLPFVLVADGPNPASGTAGSPIDFPVRLEQGGLPVAGATIGWSAAAPFAPASASVVTDAAGVATASFTPSAGGSFVGVVVASFDPDGVPASGDEVQVAFDADVAVVRTLAIVGGDGQDALVGSAYAATLDVLAEDSGLPAAGVPITWAVAAGAASIVPGGPTDAAGLASATVTPSAPGALTITATRGDDPAATVSFNLTATSPPLSMAATTPNPAAGVVGEALAFGVQVEQGGLPVAGASITWSAGPPFAPASAATVTDAGGLAGASFIASGAGSFPGAVVATLDPDGVPASGDELQVVFDADIAAVPGLAIDSGDGQSGVAGQPFAAPLVVLADDSGAPAAGVGITWTVGGGATLVPSGPTGADGRASATLTAGPEPGPVQVTATRQDAPGASVTFNLAVDALGLLEIVSGDDQTLRAGSASEPLVVRLLDAGGAPVPAATISWSTSAGQLSAASATTDAAGEARTVLTVDAAGGARVTASSPLAQAPAVFALKGALSDLAGMTTRQAEVAAAVDTLCPALAALPSPTAEQRDLLQRCLELTDAAAIDPAATVFALDQLLADVALVQANAAFAAVQSQFQNLRARIAALRSGTQGSDFGGLALTTPQGLFSIGLLGPAFGQDETGVPPEIGADFSRWGFFAAGTLGRAEVEPGRVDPAYDMDIEGLTAGVDYRVSDQWIVGGSLGITRQDSTLPDDRGEVETSGWTVSAYTTWYRADSWYLDGVLTWGRNDYDLLRHIRYTVPLAGGGSTTIDQRARSSSDGDVLSAAFTFGRDFNRGAWGLGPYGRLLFTRLDFDTIEERLDTGIGTGLGLRIEQRELESLASVLGGKLTYTHSTDWGVLMPHLQLEWEHEFRDDPQALEARFLHDPTLTPLRLRGDPLDTDYYRIGLGLSMVLTKGRSGFFYYERLLGKDRTSQYNLALGFRMEF